MPDLPREELVSAAFVELADTLVRDFDVMDFLHTLAERCIQLLDVTAAGVLLAGCTGAVVDVAASDDGTRKLEAAGVGWGEGPGLDCCRVRGQVADVPLAGRTAGMRWPRFAPRARRLGFTSVVSAPLHLHDEAIGSLNLYRDTPGPLDVPQLRLGQALADIATIGILQQRAVTELKTVSAQLQCALESRVVIEQAKGFLSQRRRTGVEEAFQAMRVYARAHQTRLTVVAGQVLDGTVDPAVLPPVRSGQPES